MGILDFSTAVAWKPLALEALEGPPPLARLAARSWLWAGGLVPGGYSAAGGPPGLRLGARFGLPKPLLRAAWAGAYVAAAAALAVLWRAPVFSKVSSQPSMLKELWSGEQCIARGRSCLAGIASSDITKKESFSPCRVCDDFERICPSTTVYCATITHCEPQQQHLDLQDQVTY